MSLGHSDLPTLEAILPTGFTEVSAGGWGFLCQGSGHMELLGYKPEVDSQHPIATRNQFCPVLYMCVWQHRPLFVLGRFSWVINVF